MTSYTCGNRHAIGAMGIGIFTGHLDHPARITAASIAFIAGVHRSVRRALRRGGTAMAGLVHPLDRRLSRHGARYVLPAPLLAPRPRWLGTSGSR
ncbi:MAG: hypothetical protein ABSA15_02730, partial [Thermoplasmata archaeon]